MVTMTLDLRFSAKNRLEFTRESLDNLCRNTNWSLVDNFVIYDDGSTDGTLEFLQSCVFAEVRQTSFGSGILVANDFISRSEAEFVATLDNDAMVPPGWLGIGLEVLQNNPELQVLGLEQRGIKGNPPYTYRPSNSLDGLYIARRSLFEGKSLPGAITPYEGWSQWLKANQIRMGWIVPSLPVFLLDRIPFSPWIDLSQKYEALGWQRPLTTQARLYSSEDAHLWSWCKW